MYSKLAQRLKASNIMGTTVMSLSVLDLLCGIIAVFTSFFLLPAVISSMLTGIVLVFGFGMYDKLSRRIPFAATQTQIETLIKNSKLFSKSNILLSAFDIIAGILAILIIGISVNEVVFSVLIGITLIKNARIFSTAISGIIQLRKFKALYIATGVLSISYIATRKNHFIKRGGINGMKELKKWIKSNPRTLTAVTSTVGSLGLALLQILGQIDWGVITPIVSGILGVLGLVFAGWAGFETPAIKSVRDDAVAEYLEKIAAESKLLAEAQALLHARQEEAVKKIAEELKQKVVEKPVVEKPVVKKDVPEIPVA